MMATEDSSTHLPVVGFEDLGLVAFVTTRATGSFGLVDHEDAPEASARWHHLQRSLAQAGVPGLASARQVHGTQVLLHRSCAPGWVRHPDADGHLLWGPGALAVTVADCIPVFLAHEDGPIGMVHAGWRGVAGGILAQAVGILTRAGHAPHRLRLHLGPSICGRCYEVSPDVFEQLTGTSIERPQTVDLRGLLAQQAQALGVGRWTADHWCTRCDNDRFYSHRAGDTGRQVGVIARSA